MSNNNRPLIQIDYKTAETLYNFVWYMLASHKETFRCVPPEARNVEQVQIACDKLMEKLNNN